ncbi:hypothetical protein [Gorillibacterium sp. sgz5001074]|uniref:hypothetical protein n=1 Tax=Gorillibacterium sp. sgz5001074 TaxID=3446695 RepID=UPI003F680A85
MRNIFCKQAVAAAALSAAVFLAGCTGYGASPEAAGDRAGRLMERTMSLLEKEKPAYRTETEVLADGVAVPRLKAEAAGTSGSGPDTAPAPGDIVKLLREGGYTVKLTEEQGAAGVTVLTAEGQPEAWTAWNKREWKSRISAMEAGAAGIIEQRTARLSGTEAVRLRSELTDSLNLARSKMEGILGTLQAGGTVTVRLKGGAVRPDTVTVENKLQYTADGRERSETIRTVYQFGQAASGSP